MKIKCIFTKDEFKIVEEFVNTVSHKLEVLYPIGESLMCEIELAGESAHILFHAGIHYHCQRMDEFTTK